MAFIVLDLGGPADRRPGGRTHPVWAAPRCSSRGAGAGVVGLAYARASDGVVRETKRPPGLGGLRDEGCSSR